METRIEEIEEKKLIGKTLKMSFSNNKTSELWQSFMPERKYIKNTTNSYLYSIEKHENTTFFSNFNPNTKFEKSAAIEVSSFEIIPEGMEKIIIPKGLYAVFIYKGKASEAESTYRYIYTEWLPNSVYELDNRPNFALMGDKYKNEDPNSEEELWFPIKYK